MLRDFAVKSRISNANPLNSTVPSERYVIIIEGGYCSRTHHVNMQYKYTYICKVHLLLKIKLWWLRELQGHEELSQQMESWFSNYFYLDNFFPVQFHRWLHLHRTLAKILNKSSIKRLDQAYPYCYCFCFNPLLRVKKFDYE